MKILIIDDSPVYRLVIRRELNAQPELQIFECNNGQEALDFLKIQKVDVITLDVEMPGLNGFETCRAIRELEESSNNNPGNMPPTEKPDTPRTPIIFLTSTDTIQGRTKGFEAGATDFLSKSFTKGELRIAIQRLLHPEKRLTGVRALIVDPNLSARKMTAQFLLQLGVEILEAESARQAYEILEQQGHFIDLLITEQLLPDYSGVKLCSKVRTELGLKKLPIVFVTAENDRSQILDYFQVGATDYLTKPYLKEELLGRLHVHLEIQLLYNNLEKNVVEMQNLDRIKDQFLAACSHDLKGPLNGIMGFSNLLLESDNLTETQKDWIKTMLDSGEFLLNLINNLLDISRIQIQKGEIKVKSTNVIQLIQKCITSYQVVAKSKNIEVTFCKQEGAPEIASIDPTIINRVVGNLVSNAIKFTRPQGKIEISLMQQPETELFLKVSDTGIGIAPDQLPRLFEQFTDASRLGTKGENSTGLGLSIVRDLIKKHGGTISVTSQIDQGSSFTVTIPSPRKAAAPAA